MLIRFPTSGVDTGRLAVDWHTGLLTKQSSYLHKSLDTGSNRKTMISSEFICTWSGTHVFRIQIEAVSVEEITAFPEFVLMR